SEMALLPSADLPAILELFREERFAEAERALALVPASQQGPELLLVHAEVQVNMGRHADAEALGRKVLALRPRDAGAHFLLAVCREKLGDPAGARRGHEATIRLDPGFALAHLHLGRLAREEGDGATARREIGKALDLLATEDAARLLLFGGGFAREALLDLCRSQLRGSGGDG
ncbi:MAG: tetratricopeptide repeat protein, partial [Minicystis sp.]